MKSSFCIDLQRFMLIPTKFPLSPSLPYPLNWLYNHGRVGMAGMPYPPTDCRSYIKINMNTYLIIEFVSLITAEAGDLRYDIYV